MKHTVTLYRGMSQYTAYEGISKRAALQHIDTARNTLVLTKGTATITHRIDDRLKSTLEVIDGFHGGPQEFTDPAPASAGTEVPHA